MQRIVNSNAMRSEFANSFAQAAVVSLFWVARINGVVRPGRQLDIACRMDDKLMMGDGPIRLQNGH